MEIVIPDLERLACLPACLLVGIGNVHVLHEAEARIGHVSVQPAGIAGMFGQYRNVRFQKVRTVVHAIGPDAPRHRVDTVLAEPRRGVWFTGRVQQRRVRLLADRNLGLVVLDRVVRPAVLDPASSEPLDQNDSSGMARV